MLSFSVKELEAIRYCLNEQDRRILAGDYDMGNTPPRSLIIRAVIKIDQMLDEKDCIERMRKQEMVYRQLKIMREAAKGLQDAINEVLNK